MGEIAHETDICKQRSRRRMWQTGAMRSSLSSQMKKPSGRGGDKCQMGLRDHIKWDGISQ